MSLSQKDSQSCEVGFPECLERQQEAAKKIQAVFRGNTVRDNLIKSYILATFETAENAILNPYSNEEEIARGKETLLKIRQFIDDANHTRAGLWLLGKERNIHNEEWWLEVVREHPELDLECN